MIRIYIITEVRSYGEALGQALHGAGRVEVVGSSGHPMEALEDLVAMDVDVVLLDVPWPEGPLWAAEIRAVAPEVLVVVLGLAEAEHRMITWAQAGVAGYLGREASLEEFGEAIEGATRREPSFLPETATIRLRRIAAAADALSPACGQRSLTTREREILQLVGQGLSNQQIARRLYIALPTVKNHVHNILEKLGVHRRIDAVAEVRRGGFGFGGGPLLRTEPGRICTRSAASGRRYPGGGGGRTRGIVGRGGIGGTNASRVSMARLTVSMNRSGWSVRYVVKATLAPVSKTKRNPLLSPWPSMETLRSRPNWMSARNRPDRLNDPRRKTSRRRSVAARSMFVAAGKPLSRAMFRCSTDRARTMSRPPRAPTPTCCVVARTAARIGSPGCSTAEASR